MTNNSLNDFPPHINHNLSSIDSRAATRLNRACPPSLGIYAESSSTREKLQDRDELPSPKDAATKARFRLQRQAARLLPGERLAECMRQVAPDALYVSANYSPGQKSSYFSNLKVCESYCCPVCAVRRAEQDRHELSVALAEAAKRDWYPVLLTFTLRHTIADDLASLQIALAGAFDACFSGRWYQDFKYEYQVQGKIKAWEVTYGRNGHHPHLHVLMFMRGKLNDYQLQGLKSWLADRWIEMLARRGYDATWTHGVDVRSGDSQIAEYIAKFGREPLNPQWGVDSEIARIPTKKAHLDGLTPFELLAASGGDSASLKRLSEIHPNMDTEGLKTRAGQLFREIFYAFKRKPRLYWGTLKRTLELDLALMNFEAANEKPDDTISMVLIERGHDWLAIHGGYAGTDLRADLLNVVRSGDAFKVEAWLKANNLPGIVPDEAKRLTLEARREAAARPIEPTNAHRLSVEYPDPRSRDAADAGRRWSEPPGEGWRLSWSPRMRSAPATHIHAPD